MLRFKGKKRAVAAATARLRGLNQIRPPSKTQAFLGRPNFANARALCEMARADVGSSSQPSQFAAARAGPAQPRNKIQSKFTKPS